MTPPDPSQQQPDPDIQPNVLSSKIPSPQRLSALFTSLSRPSRPWRLTRTLRSDNPAEINGQLTGTATFTFLKKGSDSARDMLYREEGGMPSTLIRGMAGLRWTKKYIWRLREDGAGISVWFVKVGGVESQTRNQNQESEDEADYLFHEFDFSDSSSGTDDMRVVASEKQDQDEDSSSGSILVTPPVPPLPNSRLGSTTTTVLTARGNHLCVNDMYRTAYSFRIRPETGEVLSWTSRHVVKGPKKDQDIVNLYTLEE
ncbi:hypothetical protein DTO271G3_5621 [Paecilomyces variotii]|nr:hypothetical protein DTO271G3_5621 [Paecilomyces variotii]